jgi:rRNA maturation endonuclease Nob1
MAKAAQWDLKCTACGKRTQPSETKQDRWTRAAGLTYFGVEVIRILRHRLVCDQCGVRGMVMLRKVSREKRKKALDGLQPLRPQATGQAAPSWSSFCPGCGRMKESTREREEYCFHCKSRLSGEGGR